MFDCHLHTISKILDDHLEITAATIVPDKWKCFAASIHGSLSETLLSFSWKAGAVGGVRDDSSHGRKQPLVVVHLQLRSGWISHWFPQRGRRMPPGSLGNNTTHRRKVVYGVATGRSSRISRRCTAPPACRIVSRELSLNYSLHEYFAVSNLGGFESQY